MPKLRSIRLRLNLSQVALGAVMDCVQGNITAYEREVNPRPVPHRRAAMLIDYAKTHGLPLSFDHIYGDEALPEPMEAAHG